MIDWAHDWTDDQIKALEKRFSGTYSQAAKELRKRADKLMAGYEEKLARLAKGGHEPTKDELRGLLGTSVGRVNELAGTLAETATKANEAAFNTINDALPGIYAENANWAAYQVDKGIGMNTGFQLVDESTVRRLMLTEEDDQIIHEFTDNVVRPDMQTLRANLDAVKDVRWNRQKFTASITQSILQGESIPHMTERLERVLNMDKNMATRAARTAATSAENAGRVDSFKRAKRIGIDLEQEWMAAIDGRTRTSHRELDGQHVPVGEKFYAKSTGHEIEFPGDPKAHPSETYNCRCTLVAWTPEMAAESVKRWSKLPEGTTYDDWKATAAKQLPKEAAKVQPTIADMSAQVWQMAGEDAYNAGNWLLSQADEDISSLWTKHEQDLVMLNPTFADGARYRPNAGVLMNIKDDINDQTTGRMSTFFHEFGHHIDHVGGRKLGGFGYISDQYRTPDGKTFGDVLRKEVDAKISATHKKLKAEALEKAMERPFDEISNVNKLWFYGEITQAQYKKFKEPLDAWKRVRGITAKQAEDWYGMSADEFAKAVKAGEKNELALRKAIASRKSTKKGAYEQVARDIGAMQTKEKHSLSDIFDGATSGKCQDGWGHGKNYWEAKPTGLEREAFAEFFSAEVVKAETPETLATLKEWLPESYSTFREMVKEAL